LNRAAAVQELDAGIQIAVDVDRALDDPRVGAVDVCLPHHLHEPICLRAIAAGRDVLCEKPLAPELAGADRMTDAANAAGRLLMVAENECFHPVYERVAEIVADGAAVGAPALVQATRECYLRDAFMQDRPWFLRRDQSGGGILLSGGVHDFAKLRMMLGEITTVHAAAARQRFSELESEDTVVLMLEFANGVVGTLVESFLMLDPVTAAGEEVHRLRIDGDAGSLEVIQGARLRICNADGTYEVHLPAADTFRAQAHEFLRCVRSRDEPRTSARRQRRNLELVHAAYTSIAGGQPVRL
jgi:predicted dehydrogenase